MKTIKSTASVSALVLGMTAIALTVSSATASAVGIMTVKMGQNDCGTVTSVSVQNNVIILSGFSATSVACGLSTGGQGGDPIDPIDPPVTIPPVTTPPVVGSDARIGTGWQGAKFPNVGLALQAINERDLAGVANKFVYYTIDAGDFSGKDYIGNISVVNTTSSSGAHFASWVSSVPGGEPISNLCKTSLNAESILFWSTSYKKAPGYTCRIDAPGTYYLNVSDRTYEQLAAKKAGTCTAAKGCTFGLGVNSAIK